MKKIKKHLYRVALLAALGLGGATAAQAQINANDLILGFTSPNAASIGGNKYDYIIDLGQIPGSAGQITLSPSQFNATTFNTVLGSALAGGQAYVGIVGAHSGASGDVILSADVQPTTSGSASFLRSAAGYPDGLGLGQVNQTGSSFFENISQGPGQLGAAANNFTLYAQSPLYAITASQGTGAQTIDLNLWEATYQTIPSSGVSAYSSPGFISLNLNGGNLGVAFNQEALAVPEPATYALLGAAGVLLLVFRRQRRQATAKSA
ncbi:MAG TPA: PEP-CTERM sorting domain-containing protein [Verrucomicrobiae bacterium]|nr:PEP-CTERM sorting domain-containing protein [Verrucomicrobiae bacterium]